jgi:CDGSH-type Zn-finger protein
VIGSFSITARGKLDWSLTWEPRMPEVSIKTRENGPLLVTGPIQLVDHLGQEYNLAGMENVALCRCGQSEKRPFCDGSHRSCGFVAGETAPPATSSP